MVVFIVILLIVLGYFGFNLREHLSAPAIKENLATFWGWIVSAWNWFVATLKSLLPASN